ncbi:CBS domain-containing protein [Marinicrinis lubricantis]|uniref:CBS domain-containing protein n=1 Tax=Marinicrinis lubricantis TaxID=2086470 RepID=A0ABW1IUZ3_9BACL
MRAQDIMISPVYKVKENDTVRAVIERFMEHRISGVPVVNDRNEIVAYISDGDIMRYIGKQKDLFFDSVYYIGFFKANDEDYEERVKRVLDLNVMTIAKKKVIKVEVDEKIENVAAILGNRQIKKLPVERSGVLVGIISRGDVIRHSFQSLL